MGKLRKIVQFVSTLISNGNIKGLVTGMLYQGTTKGLCVPGLNCYSCPAATASCPMGLLQSALGNIKRTVNFYIAGVILLFGTVLGRFICGWLCPFGLLQELLYKIPLPKIKKSLGWLPRMKYAVLFVFVIVIPVGYMLAMGMGIPGFCKYICPQGTLAGLSVLAANEPLREMAGANFIWKVILLVMIILWSVTIFRPFCRVLCPLGLLYGFFNPISLVHMERNAHVCTGCGTCNKICPMEVDVLKNHNGSECIRCGKCADSCPEGALRLTFGFQGGKEDCEKIKNEV